MHRAIPFLSILWSPSPPLLRVCGCQVNDSDSETGPFVSFSPLPSIFPVEIGASPPVCCLGPSFSVPLPFPFPRFLSPGSFNPLAATSLRLAHSVNEEASRVLPMRPNVHLHAAFRPVIFGLLFFSMRILLANWALNYPLSCRRPFHSLSLGEVATQIRCPRLLS